MDERYAIQQMLSGCWENIGSGGYDYGHEPEARSAFRKLVKSLDGRHGLFRLVAYRVLDENE